MQLNFLASIHLNHTALLQMQAVHSFQTLQHTFATECKNKETEKEKRTKKKKKIKDRKKPI
jgi:hypothetical protein